MASLRDYKMITLTHRQMNLSDLGAYFMSESDSDGLKKGLQRLKDEFALDELLYLSTCNRVLFFFSASIHFESDLPVRFFKSVNAGLNQSQLDLAGEKAVYLEGLEAIGHLLQLASSIDSMVIGEREIIRQLRESYKSCKKWGLTGDNIRLAMRFAVETAKKIYAGTRIGEKPLSIVSLALQQLLHHLHNPDAPIILVGAGQTNRLVAKLLLKKGYCNFKVFNRTLEHARQLCKDFGGEAFPLKDLHTWNKGFDVLIVSTGSEDALINDQVYSGLVQGDKEKKIVLDLSLPNGVSSEVVNNHPMTYIQIDDLRSKAKENFAFRAKEVERVKVLLAAKMDQFETMHEQRQIEKALGQVPGKMREIKEKALQSVFKSEVENLDPEKKVLLGKLLDYMEKKCISIPMSIAKQVVKPKE